jgi:hypothetical protein
VVLLNVFMPAVELGRVVTESRKEGLAYLGAERRMFLERKAEQVGGLRVTTRVEVLRHSEEIDEGIARVAAEVGAAPVILASGRLTSTAGVPLGSYTQGCSGGALARLWSCGIPTSRIQRQLRVTTPTGRAVAVEVPPLPKEPPSADSHPSDGRSAACR